MDNLNIYNKVKTVPPEALKEIKGGRLKGMSDINPMWRIKILTETFGLCGFGWKYETTNKWLEASSTGEVAAFVDINLYINIDDKWSEPIPGTGGSLFVANETRGARMSDECYKMASTDAISVACKALGIGASIYWDKDKTKYSNTVETPQQNKPPIAAPPPTSPPADKPATVGEKDMTPKTAEEALKLSFRNGDVMKPLSQWYKEDKQAWEIIKKTVTNKTYLEAFRLIDKMIENFQKEQTKGEAPKATTAVMPKTASEATMMLAISGFMEKTLGQWYVEDTTVVDKLRKDASPEIKEGIRLIDEHYKELKKTQVQKNQEKTEAAKEKLRDKPEETGELINAAQLKLLHTAAQGKKNIVPEILKAKGIISSTVILSSQFNEILKAVENHPDNEF